MPIEQRTLNSEHSPPFPRLRVVHKFKVSHQESSLFFPSGFLLQRLTQFAILSATMDLFFSLSPKACFVPISFRHSRPPCGYSAFMDPSAEYRKRLSLRKGVLGQSRYRGRMVSYLRLAVSLLFLVMLWLILFMKAIPAWYSLGPVLVFVVLVVYHDRLRRIESRASRAVAFYE